MDLGDYVGEHLKELQWEEVKKCQQEQEKRKYAKVIAEDIKKKIELIEIQQKKEMAEQLEHECKEAEKKGLEQIEQEKMENENKQKILKEQEEHKIKKEREVKEAKAEVRLRREMGEQIPCYLFVLSSEISSPASGDFQFGKPQGDFTSHTSSQFPGIVSTNTLMF